MLCMYVNSSQKSSSFDNFQDHTSGFGQVEEKTGTHGEGDQFSLVHPQTMLEFSTGPSFALTPLVDEELTEVMLQCQSELSQLLQQP